jgi:hypothetical protein
MIEVKPMNQKFGLELSVDKEKVLLVFKQLDYFTRNLVATKSTKYEKGKLLLDVGLVCFYNMKYGLKDLRGFSDDKGKKYKLKFEEDEKALTDDCVNELLSCSIQNDLIIAARDFGSNIPEAITNPVTNEPIEGITIIAPKDIKGALEKKY